MNKKVKCPECRRKFIVQWWISGGKYTCSFDCFLEGHHRGPEKWYRRLMRKIRSYFK